MFTNLIESEFHRKEFKRCSSFFLITIAAYALLLFAAGIASIYAYDARLEAQSTDIMLLSWVPPVTTTPVNHPDQTQRVRSFHSSNAPVDENIRVQERTIAVSTTADPSRTPDNIGIKASVLPPATGDFKLTGRNVDPPAFPSNNSNGCASCPGSDTVVRVAETTPPPVPTPIKPKMQTVTSRVLASKAISIPKPVYPPLARQIHIEGTVAVQILVDENGKVVAAHAVSGHPTLTAAAVEAAYRARFTATLLNDQPVKVQGVITYNFTLQ